jgi:hypothetical protein
METKTDLVNEFNAWVNIYAKRVEDTEGKFVVGDKLYNTDELFAHFKDLKVTEIDILGYDRHFTIKLYRDKYYTLDEAITYVSKEIVDTAMVKTIRHIGWAGDKDCVIENPAFEDKSYFNGKTTRASQYYKDNVKINEVVTFK